MTSSIEESRNGTRQRSPVPRHLYRVGGLFSTESESWGFDPSALQAALEEVFGPVDSSELEAFAFSTPNRSEVFLASDPPRSSDELREVFARLAGGIGPSLSIAVERDETAIWRLLDLFGDGENRDAEGANAALISQAHAILRVPIRDSLLQTLLALGLRGDQGDESGGDRLELSTGTRRTAALHAEALRIWRLHCRLGGRRWVLAAHGAGEGSDANRSIQRLAKTLRARFGLSSIETAFHLGEPGFEAFSSCSDTLITPLLTSRGYFHGRLNEALAHPKGGHHRGDTPGPGPSSLAPIGEDPLTRDVLLDELASQTHAHPAHRLDIVVIGHGTRRHGRSGDATRSLAQSIRSAMPGCRVEVAFLDQDPELGNVVRRLSQDAIGEERRLVLLPFLLGYGSHAREDIGAALDESQRDKAIVLPPLLDLPRLPELLAELVIRGRSTTYRARATPTTEPFRAETSGRPEPPPTVAIIGAGPGDPSLLTLRARELLDTADVVVHDRLVSAEILSTLPRSARLIDVGKARGDRRGKQERIHRRLIQEARCGNHVVRLKGGDPYVFGRGSEEQDALIAAGLEVEMVPGLSSALTAPLAAGIPVTERGISRAFAVLTVETQGGVDFTQLRRLALADTLVLLMGAARLAEIARELMHLGRAPGLPAAAVERGTQPGQRIVRTTLENLADAVARDGLRAPMTVVIGEVARRAGLNPPRMAASRRALRPRPLANELPPRPGELDVPSLILPANP